MVAGDTRKVIVIKNIASNLIEEAILILKNNPDTKECNQDENQAQRKSNTKNDFILKEAEGIINQYLRENGLGRSKNRHRPAGSGILHFKLSANTAVNILMIAAIALLFFVISKMF